jgi:hypothetical protein
VRWVVEFTEEIRVWYVGLTPAGKAAADRSLERLATQGNMLRMPHSRPLDDGLYELRFTCERVNRRITYVFEPSRHAIMLTTFHKQRQNERAEILRARRAQAARAAAGRADGEHKRKR